VAKAELAQSYIAQELTILRYTRSGISGSEVATVAILASPSVLMGW
jgi:hypothetical protein